MNQPNPKRSMIRYDGNGRVIPLSNSSASANGTPMPLRDSGNGEPQAAASKQSQQTGTNGKAHSKPEKPKPRPEPSDPLDYEGADPSDYTDLALAKRFAKRLIVDVIGERVWNERTREWNQNPSAVSLATLALCDEEAKKLRRV